MPTIYGLPSDGSIPDSLAELLDVADVPSSSFLARGITVALGGDSITDGAGATNVTVDAWRAYLGKILGGARVSIVEHGVPGESAGGLLNRVPAILDGAPGAFVVMIGTNPSNSVEQYIEQLGQILDLARAARVPTVLCTIPPKGAGEPNLATHQPRIGAYNLVIRHIAAQRGIPVADVFGALVDPATGTMRPEYDHDNTHPTPAGHLAIAKTVAAVLDDLLPQQPGLVTSAGAPGLLVNPLMLPDEGGAVPGWGLSAGVATGATYSTTAVDPVPGDGLAAGKWARFEIDATAATSSTSLVRHMAMDPVPAPGDVLLVSAQVKADPDIGRREPGTVQLVDGTTIKSIIGQTFGVVDPGPIRRLWTVPAEGFAGVPRIRYGVSASAGEINVAYIGALQVFNLTALGVAGFVDR